MSEPTKKDFIESLRKINAVAREHLPKEFCDEVDAALLFSEDVASDEVQ